MKFPNETRRAFIAALLGFHYYTDDWRKWLYESIGRWSSHYSFRRGSRDEELEKKLARIIDVEVYLRKNGDNNSFVCRARIMTFDAPSKPLD